MSCSWLIGLIKKDNVFPECWLSQNINTVCRQKAVSEATGYQKPEGANMEVHEVVSLFLSLSAMYLYKFGFSM